MFYDFSYWIWTEKITLAYQSDFAVAVTLSETKGLKLQTETGSYTDAFAHLM